MTIKTNGEVKRNIKYAKKLALTLSKNKKVIGVVLLGGIAKGYTDKYSDIDIAIFTNNRRYTEISPGEQYIYDLDFDILVLYYPDLKKMQWSQVQKEAYYDHIILFDRNNIIKNLLLDKLNFSKKECLTIYIENILYLGWHGINPYGKLGTWRGYEFSLIPDLWIFRRDVVNGHYILNYCVDYIIKLLYAYNKTFLPDKKWRYARIKSLKWLPFDFNKCFKKSLNVRYFTEQEFYDRLKNMENIYSEILLKIEKEGLLPEDIYTYFKKLNKDYSIRGYNDTMG